MRSINDKKLYLNIFERRHYEWLAKYAAQCCAHDLYILISMLRETQDNFNEVRFRERVQQRVEETM